MPLRADTQNWIAMSDYDIGTAEHMLNTGRYLYVIFMCHLALEKMLKAHVTEATKEIPRKTHDLLHLVNKAKLDVPRAYLDFIGKINSASIPTRYPEDLNKMLKLFPKPVADDYLKLTKEVIAWLKSHPNLN
ncbi:MAG: hypothetical protein B6D41_18590 [Chloroflexi bacterium UTCFX4]|jgi:HEPN domain-containing protein|nr:MAG: hypothetical protein B6D41_18590 [Chloroflexi bacterium UTCFX4]